MGKQDINNLGKGDGGEGNHLQSLKACDALLMHLNLSGYQCRSLLLAYFGTESHWTKLAGTSCPTVNFGSCSDWPTSGSARCNV